MPLIFDEKLMMYPPDRARVKDPQNRYSVRQTIRVALEVGLIAPLVRLTHTPAHHVLDRITLGDNVGCPSLRSRLASLRPRLHLSGHIHEAHGAYINTWDSANNFEPPKVQNDDTVVSTSQIIGGEGGEETTVFVNAANWPMGPKASRKGVNPDFGKGAFQAVVVDLKE